MSTATRDRTFRRDVLNAARTSKGIRCAKCRRHFPERQMDADHITALADDGPDDPSNGQALCKPCHKTKSAKEAARRARGARWPRWVAAAGAFSGGLPLVAAASRAADGAPFPALTDVVHDTTGAALAGMTLAATIALAPRAVRAWWASEAGPRADNKPTNTPPAPTIDTGQRIAEAVNNLLPTGRTVTVSEHKGGAWRVDYKGTGLRDHDEERRVEVLEAITAKTGRRWIDTWHTDQDHALLTPRPALPTKVDHPGWAERPWHVLPVGVGAHGEIAFDLMKTAHLLIVGTTGAGKTVAIRSILGALAWQAARGRIEMVVLDPKRVELIAFRGWPGVRSVDTEPEAMWDAPLKVAAEMHRRLAAFEHQGVPLGAHKPWVVVIDEFEQFVEVMGELADEPDEKGKPRERTTQKRKASSVRAVSECLRMARKCGIHFIIGTQRADAGDVIDGRARNNIAGRLLVGRADADASRMAFGAGTHGRDIPDQAKGRATIRNGTGKPEEVQLYWFPDPADADQTNTDADWALLDQLRASIKPTTLTKEQS